MDKQTNTQHTQHITQIFTAIYTGKQVICKILKEANSQEKLDLFYSEMNIYSIINAHENVIYFIYFFIYCYFYFFMYIYSFIYSFIYLFLRLDIKFHWCLSRPHVNFN
jgi:hypothetical protein